MTKPSDLEMTLSWLGMSKYLERFEEAGFDSWDTLLEITEDDLETLNVDLGHRRKLQKEIANAKRVAQTSPLATRYGVTVQPVIPPFPMSSSDDAPQVPSKRGYRHHPKQDSHAPERPYSAYVLFSNHTRDQLKDQALSFTKLSRQVGERWQALSPAERDYWKQKAAIPWEKYKEDLAQYQKTEQYQEYQKYLEEFRAAEARKHPEKKQGSTHRSSPLLGKKPGNAGGSSEASPKPVEVRRQTAPIESSGGPSEARASKMPIQRLKQEPGESQARREGNRSARVRQACEPCRSRKIKCHGEQPTCRHCQEVGVRCFYESGKRDGKKQQDGGLWHKVKVYEDLLLRVASQVDDDEQKAIQKAVQLPPLLDSPTNPDKAAFPARTDDVGSEENDAASEPSGVGSMGSTDHVNQENFEQGGAFVGQASGDKWMRKLTKELGQEGPHANIGTQFNHHRYIHRRGQGAASQDPSPFGEDMETSIVGHQIDPFSLPIKRTADALLNSFFATVQLSFPMINKEDFLFQYGQIWSSHDLTTYQDRTFLSILQLVFAIGAVHAHLIEADWAGDGRDHMLYFAQARMQAVDTGILNDVCYLGQVQVFGLGSMYLVATDQINRAWNLNGLAIRAAQSLGLHLRDATSSLSPLERTTRARIWYSIKALESMLTVITGRPSMINDEDCTVPIIHALSEELAPSVDGISPSDVSAAKKSSTRRSSSSVSESSRSALKMRVLESSKMPISSTYFMYYTELCALAKEVVGILYHPKISQCKWSEVQAKMDTFNKRLQQLQDSLHPIFKANNKSSDPEVESCRVALLILFYSTSTIINRPCLCRIDERMGDQSSTSKNRNRAFANNCVESARHILDLILNEPESTILHKGVTWWMLLHHLKRALTVILLELAFRAEHMPAEAASILGQAKKAVAWLRWLGSSSPMARCTWISMSKLLYSAALKVGGDTSDIAIAPESFQFDMQHSGSRTTQLHNLRPYDQQGAPNLFQPLGMYGAAEGQYFGDLAARSELDQFGLDSWQGRDENMIFDDTQLYYDSGMLGEEGGLLGGGAPVGEVLGGEVGVVKGGLNGDGGVGMWRGLEGEGAGAVGSRSGRSRGGGERDDGTWRRETMGASLEGSWQRILR